jgi:hypothetical protein
MKMKRSVSLLNLQTRTSNPNERTVCSINFAVFILCAQFLHEEQLVNTRKRSVKNDVFII